MVTLVAGAVSNCIAYGSIAILYEGIVRELRRLEPQELLVFLLGL